MHSIVRDKTEHTFKLAFSSSFVHDLYYITDFFLHLESHKWVTMWQVTLGALLLMIFDFWLDAIVVYNYNDLYVELIEQNYRNSLITSMLRTLLLGI